MEEKKEIQDLLIGEQLRDLSFLWIKPAEVEQPYRDLLCHEHDMTSTLAEFHGGEVELQIFEEGSDSDCYFREVLLRVGDKPVEYGLIRIFLGNFPTGLWSAVTEGRKPLGAILNESGLEYSSRPGGFFKISGKTFQPDFFPSSGGGFLFGRYNELVGVDETVFARIIEILPKEKL
ncbi:MAG: hypothetical protein HN570_00810 [Verrucomicrobia bacterium]|jgi:hypothetical protein|nr:hypothetical protein [Verrucomicrobiota bacterium]MDA7611003.1 hypothetical protein [bacterium]MDB2639486.1 hypothetical protein [Akkermansiaceae bacterium]MBT7969511.1 hypothetical protein [Verrucomicrobiota bacterium]MDB4622429.1 hypothetical protein [Akkermansiaceae bacterium]